MSAFDYFEKLCDLIAQGFRALFSAARAFVIMKMTAFGLFIWGTNAGLWAKGSLDGRRRIGDFELQMSEPGSLQLIVVLVGFAFVLGVNVYVFLTRREDERKLRELEDKAPPKLRKCLRRRKRKDGKS